MVHMRWVTLGVLSTDWWKNRYMLSRSILFFDLDKPMAGNVSPLSSMGAIIETSTFARGEKESQMEPIAAYSKCLMAGAIDRCRPLRWE